MAKDANEDAFRKELVEVDNNINPFDYTEDYDDIDAINAKTLNELREMLLTDGSSIYNEDGSLSGPNAAYSRYMKLLELKKMLTDRGIKCSDDSTDWYSAV